MLEVTWSFDADLEEVKSDDATPSFPEACKTNMKRTMIYTQEQNIDIIYIYRKVWLSPILVQRSLEQHIICVCRYINKVLHQYDSDTSLYENWKPKRPLWEPPPLPPKKTNVTEILKMVWLTYHFLLGQSSNRIRVQYCSNRLSWIIHTVKKSLSCNIKSLLNSYKQVYKLKI